jgi:hypothetical protein
MLFEYYRSHSYIFSSHYFLRIVVFVCLLQSLIPSLFPILHGSPCFLSIIDKTETIGSKAVLLLLLLYFISYGGMLKLMVQCGLNRPTVLCLAWVKHTGLGNKRPVPLGLLPSLLGCLLD